MGGTTVPMKWFVWSGVENVEIEHNDSIDKFLVSLLFVEDVSHAMIGQLMKQDTK